jgi:phosphate transport system ATP-binding protein
LGKIVVAKFLYYSRGSMLKKIKTYMFAPSRRSNSIDNEPPPSLEARGLTLCYGSRPAFEDVTLPVKAGSITALVGPSGCGKTSFLSCLNRLTDLIPGSRVSGEVRVGGSDVLDPRTDIIALRRYIGMIFQKPNPFPLSIRKNLEYPLREHNIKDREQLDRIIEGTLKDVGLWEDVGHRLDSPALSLSGGQQQRLVLARALALQPKVLLMDEPCSALDPVSSSVVEDHILGLRGRYTVLVVTHNLAQARRIADNVALFWIQNGSGRLVEHASVEQFFQAPQDELTAAYVNGARG